MRKAGQGSPPRAASSPCSSAADPALAPDDISSFEHISFDGILVIQKKNRCVTSPRVRSGVGALVAASCARQPCRRPGRIQYWGSAAPGSPCPGPTRYYTTYPSWNVPLRPSLRREGITKMRLPPAHHSLEAHHQPAASSPLLLLGTTPHHIERESLAEQEQHVYRSSCSPPGYAGVSWPGRCATHPLRAHTSEIRQVSLISCPAI